MNAERELILKDREQAKAEVNWNLENYLSSRGINTRVNFKCLNPDHQDSNPSMGYDRGQNKVHCFGCQANYDLIDLVMIDYNLEFPQALDKACELYGIAITPLTSNGNRSTPVKARQIIERAKEIQEKIQPKQQEVEYIKKAHARAADTDYFQQRGISQPTIDRFKLGYEPTFKTKDSAGNYAAWRAIIIPTGADTYTVRNTDTEAQKLDRVRKRGGASVIFNPAALQSGNPVFVTEGELDALSLYEIGAEAVALGSTSNSRRFLDIVRQQPPAGTLILSLDNDQDGEKAAEEIAKELQTLGIFFLKANISGSCKDPNEALTKDREAFKREVHSILNIQTELEGQQEDEREAQQEQERAAYQQTAASHYLEEFNQGIKDSVNTPYIPTGFTALDSVLDGGLYEGLYIIGAISSLGKTTLVLQIADQIAQQGQDVLVFSLEMARAELIAKSLSRLTYLLAELEGISAKKAKTTRGITTGKRYPDYSREEIGLIQKSMTEYATYANNLYIIEGRGKVGAGKIREDVEKHVSITGRKPIIIIDYLQILAPLDPRATDKRNTDDAVRELKEISRDYKIPVLAISSFNRENYSAAVSMTAFKESGAIEYSSDVLIGLQALGAGVKDFDIDAAKRKDPREIELKILKNRNGSTGDTLEYKYFPLFNYFMETTRNQIIAATTSKTKR